MASASALALALLPLAACAQNSSAWDSARLQMPWPPPPSSIVFVALVLVGLCIMLGVLAMDAHGMYMDSVRKTEEERRALVLSGGTPKRRMSVAEMFGFGGQSHFRQGAIKIDRKIVNQRKGH